MRVGILGCANIAKKNAIAICDKDSGCHITAVASRSQEKADAFVLEFLASRITDGSKTDGIARLSSYDDLLVSSIVDAVYIPLPTTMHKEWVLKALRAGKHCLLEKPVALSEEDFSEMLAVAKEQKVYLQDGTMFVHHPRTRRFVQAVQDPAIMGKLQRVEAGFSFCGGEDFHTGNIRIKKDADPLGCLGDLGWYVIRIALLVLGSDRWQVTSAQVTDYTLNTDEVPIDATCVVKFQQGIVLAFHCGFCSQFRQYVKVVGPKQWVSMDDFVLPKQHPVRFELNSMELTEFDLITKHTTKIEEFDGPVQEVCMWKNFARLASAVKASPEGWEGASDDCMEATQLSQMSLKNQQVLDALIKSIQNGGSKVTFITA